ncbi:MAG: PQQ-dependent sugar dehydrogenase [Bacteroidota bacterium]
MRHLTKISFGVLIACQFLGCSDDDSEIVSPDNPDADTAPNSRTVVNTLSVPWEILWGPDDFLWVTERSGQISRINPESGAQEIIADINSVTQVRESGLLGMALHPDFEASPYVYAVYTYSAGQEIVGRLVRYAYADNNLQDEVILLDNIPGNSLHNGSRIVITPDQHILMTTGDAGNTSLPQDMNSLAGKVLRINLDGSIPADNPFPGSPIYSLGHHNPQGLVLHSNGLLYSAEQDPSSDDEINIIQAGANYGWPSVLGPVDNPNEETFAQQNNVIPSISDWTPTIAPSDLVHYTSDRIPEWTNKLLMAVLKDQMIVALTLSDDGQQIVDRENYFVREYGRIRDLTIAPDGRVFIATNGNSYTDTSNTHSIIEINRLD